MWDYWSFYACGEITKSVPCQCLDLVMSCHLAPQVADNLSMEMWGHNCLYLLGETTKSVPCQCLDLVIVLPSGTPGG